MEKIPYDLMADDGENMINYVLCYSKTNPA